MHPQAYEAVGRMAGRLHITDVPLTALDIGGANWNGHARDWFSDGTRWDVLDMEVPEDVDPALGTWFAGDAREWKHPRGVKYDLILCTEVFEHVQYWEKIFLTAAAHLTDDGAIIFTCASTGRWPHGATGAPAPAPGEWYANVAPHDIELIVSKLFDDFHVEYNPRPGDAYGYAKGPRLQ